jgi:hydrogenase maturation factor
MMGATPEQERIVKEAFAEIREMNEKALEETLNSPEVKNVLDSINKTVRELNIALQTGQTDLANAQRLIASINNTVVNVGRIAADDTFPWMTAYGVDDMITSQINPANGKAQILMARQMEFIAELMAMATSPNQEVRDLIDPQYAQVLKKMFNSLGIEWG